MTNKSKKKFFLFEWWDSLITWIYSIFFGEPKLIPPSTVRVVAGKTVYNYRGRDYIYSDFSWVDVGIGKTVKNSYLIVALFNLQNDHRAFQKTKALRAILEKEKE